MATGSSRTSSGAGGITSSRTSWERSRRRPTRCTRPKPGIRDSGFEVRPVVVAVLGPTASGKSALGLALAERHGGEIINCDSTAVYRGFDIGTDKLPVDERRAVPH